MSLPGALFGGMTVPLPSVVAGKVSTMASFLPPAAPETSKSVSSLCVLAVTLKRRAPFRSQ